MLRKLTLYGGALVVLVLVMACSGDGFVHSPSSNAPGSVASPPSYIGTYKISYNGAGGSCGASAFPTALTITAATAGTDVNGQAVTLLTGSLVGGLLDGVPFANTVRAQALYSSYPAAYVQNSTSLITINAFSGYAPESSSLQAFFLLGNFPNGNGGAALQTSTCNEGADSTTITQSS